MNNFIVLNIREYLENWDNRLGEDKLVQLLSEFSCPPNRDVECFLKRQAIEFAKTHQAVTYLVLSLKDAELLGYFSITIKRGCCLFMKIMVLKGLTPDRPYTVQMKHISWYSF